MQTWYVYTYAYPDNGNIFYVGKGTGTRMFAHEIEPRGSCLCQKCGIIRSIWISGKAAQKSIVFETFVEAEAYRRESELINRYSATLVNTLGIPEDVRKKRNLEEFEMRKAKQYSEKEIARFFAAKDTQPLKPSLSQAYAEIRTAYEYCRLGPGIFIHYGGLFGLQQYPGGRFSGYREEDLIRFKAWMQENYPLVGSARREWLECEEKRQRMSSAELTELYASM